MLIKNKNLLHKMVSLDVGKTNYVIKSGSFLSDVFNHLPHGIIDKTETGIGGTSCELDSARNSIVVQPYVFTAWSKAQKPTISNKYDVHYYGNTSFRKDQDTTKSKKELFVLSLLSVMGVEENLKKYIKECKANDKPIKITCVTDQLQSLKDCLNNTENTTFEDFHLVLDEIDSLQEQSNFRNVMEPCFNIYKKHLPEKRTLISATLIKFHDPDMLTEPYSKIEYDIPTRKDLTIVLMRNCKEELIKQILQITNNSQEKIVVACNYIEYCMDVINIIKNEPSIKNRTIKLLCSPAREKQVKDYFSVMGDNGVLPGDINFTTAAYFNGFDIYDKYHSIIVADSSKSSLILSPSLIYQISGRGRNGLLSNKLLLKIVVSSKYKQYTYEELEGNVEERKLASNFIEKLKTSSNTHSKTVAEAIENIYIEGTYDYPAVNSLDEDGKIVISYLKIDNRLEQQATRKSYIKFVDLNTELLKKFKISREDAQHARLSDRKIIAPDHVKLGNELLDKLKNINRTHNFKKSIKVIKDNLQLPHHKFETIICAIYQQACIDETIDLDKVIRLIKLALSKRVFLQSLKQLKVYMDFIFYGYKIKSIKTLLETSFKLNEKFTIPELKQFSLNFAELLKDSSTTKNAAIKEIAKQILKSPSLIQFSLLKLEPKNTAKERIFKVLSYDPFDIKTDNPNY